MEIKLVGSTRNFILSSKYLKNFIQRDEKSNCEFVNLSEIDQSLLTNSNIQEDLLRFTQNYARICYSEKNWDGLVKESYKENLVERLIDSGHHSVFEHIHFNFYLEAIPKIFAMTLNNEKQYNTSEKSGRYTVMKDTFKEQKEIYDKWVQILFPEIEKAYPKIGNEDTRRTKITKLAQENARYVTSVFTPVQMGYSVNWRQLNYLMNEFENFAKLENVDDKLKERITSYLQEFNNTLKFLKKEGLENKTDRHLSLFNSRRVEEHFGDNYSTTYKISLAAEAENQRHRTLHTNIFNGLRFDAPHEFFIPQIIPENLKQEWINDLTKLSKNDFLLNGLLVEVSERGDIEDFRSKAILRMCGHTLCELMISTKNIAEKYKQYQREYGSNSLMPKCMQGEKCKEPCAWGGKMALERIV
ncbi:MAG: FAD-dependent thymidylate synthase [Nanoarchaeota archaeon]